MKEATVGIILITLSTVMYGLGNPILKKAGLNPFATITLQVMFLWLSVLPFFIITKSFQGILQNKNALLLLALAGIINAVGFYLIVKSYKYIPIWQISLITAALVPLIAAIASYFILKEEVSLKFFVGLLFTLIGLYIALR